MDVRRSSIVLGAALGAAMLWVTGPGAPLAGAAGPGGGECQLQGVANLSPPLSSASGSFAYSFTGTLGTGPMGSCQSNVAGAPTTGSLCSSFSTSAAV